MKLFIKQIWKAFIKKTTLNGFKTIKYLKDGKYWHNNASFVSEIILKSPDFMTVQA